MKQYLVIFREPDGRNGHHEEEEIKQHRKNWADWFEKYRGEGRPPEGSGLTLNGRIIRGTGDDVSNDIYRNGTEIIGGFLLIKAHDLDDATTMMQSCPIYEFNGYTEIRELQNQR